MAEARILVADDEIDIVTILKRYLELDGYKVTVSHNGKDAYAKIKAEPFDLLILDVMMPDMNGWEVCKQVKADPASKHIPVLILTARSQNADAIMSYECGAEEYVRKPFDYPELSAVIKRHLGAKG